MRTLLVVAAVAALAACGQQTTTEDVDDATVTDPAPVAPPPAATITITEADARSRIEAQGYTNVTGLMQNPDGTWSATATREGATTQVTVNDAGVQVATTPAPTTP